MSDLDDLSDDELLALLGEAVAESDGVADRHREAARAAFTWRTVDAELAELLHDSALDPGLAVRSGGDDVRTLAFASGPITLEIEIDGDEVMGQIIGGQALRITVQRPDTEDRDIATDQAGFFRIDAVGRGPLRLVVPVGDLTLVSPWVVV
jgi:hypothetical protein